MALGIKIQAGLGVAPGFWLFPHLPYSVFYIQLSVCRICSHTTIMKYGANVQQKQEHSRKLKIFFEYQASSCQQLLKPFCCSFIHCCRLADRWKPANQSPHIHNMDRLQALRLRDAPAQVLVVETNSTTRPGTPTQSDPRCLRCPAFSWIPHDFNHIQ